MGPPLAARALALALTLATTTAASGAANLGCSRGEPPTPPGDPSVAYPDLPTIPPRAPQVVPPARPSAGPAQAQSAPVPSPSAGPLPSSASAQTHDQPQADGDAFRARVRALWDAIVLDDPDRAMPMFFPVAAYQQVKDVPNPAADWRHRLVAAYAHDIHALHAALGPVASRAKLAGLEVPDDRARWVLPGEEYNKVGYYRVFGSKLRYEVDGASRAFDVKSLISWRGEWYVVHLSAIK